MATDDETVTGADPGTAAGRGDIRQRRLAGGSAIALAVLLVTALGGYAGHWKWTGFQDNDTLWDWLNLVLLPCTIAILPAWASWRRQYWTLWRLAYALLGVTFLVVLVGGYVGHWKWTGFADNTLWDWLKLLLVPFVLPLVVSAVSAAEHDRRDG